jgi:hypothetical protein
MLNTKHVTTKQVTLMRIELAMIDFEIWCTLWVWGLWLCYMVPTI